MNCLQTFSKKKGAECEILTIRWTIILKMGLGVSVRNWFILGSNGGTSVQLTIYLFAERLLVFQEGS
jgi:hypothetical protein